MYVYVLGEGNKCMYVCMYVCILNIPVLFRSQSSRSHWVPNKDFLRVGLQWFDATLVKANYLVFSDTMSVVRGWNLSQYTQNENKVILLPDLRCKHSSVKDAPHALIELSIFLDRCDHFLLTAGTFAYWAG